MHSCDIFAHFFQDCFTDFGQSYDWPSGHSYDCYEWPGASEVSMRHMGKFSQYQITTNTINMNLLYNSWGLLYPIILRSHCYVLQLGARTTLIPPTWRYWVAGTRDTLFYSVCMSQARTYCYIDNADELTCQCVPEADEGDITLNVKCQVSGWM